MKRYLLLAIPVLLIGLVILLISKRSEEQILAPQTEVQKVVNESSSSECSGKPLTPLAEGPYYKAGSPQRQKISEGNSPGINLIIKGYVFDTDCKPVANAWLDFWQADGEGNYDNNGYNFRGHQYTDEKGFFRIETVVPGKYTGRTEHIHFKARASENSPVITSQLFFPESLGNTQDSIFDKSLVINMGEDPDGSKYGSFNIVLPR